MNPDNCDSMICAHYDNCDTRTVKYCMVHSLQSIETNYYYALQLLNLFYQCKFFLCGQFSFSSI